MNTKMIATVLSIVVVLSCTSVMSLVDVDADTDEVANVNVYFYTEDGYSVEPVYAYDLYQAVASASNIEYGVTTTDRIIDYYGTDVTVHDNEWYIDYGSFLDINDGYGTLKTINGTDASEYSIYVYQNGEWTDANPAIGWYRPFADYAATATFEDGTSMGSANIAIAPKGVDKPSNDDASLMQLAEIGNGSEYRYTFHLEDSTGTVSITGSIPVTTDDEGDDGSGFITTEALSTGITIVGYGSDAYLALKNALGSNFVGQDVRTDESQGFTTFYSWMHDIFGVETVSDISEEDGYVTSYYAYWASYVSPGTSVDDYLDFTLGYYSGLAGAANCETDFIIVYEESVYTYPVD